MANDMVQVPRDVLAQVLEELRLHSRNVFCVGAHSHADRIEQLRASIDALLAAPAAAPTPTINYCCYGAYCEAGHTAECRNAAPTAPAVPPTKDALAELIRECMGDVYHCTRVWEAWNVGTMDQDDFEPYAESHSPDELADEILAAFAPAVPLNLDALKQRVLALPGQRWMDTPATENAYKAALTDAAAVIDEAKGNTK